MLHMLRVLRPGCAGCEVLVWPRGLRRVRSCAEEEEEMDPMDQVQAAEDDSNDGSGVSRGHERPRLLV